MLFPRPNVDRRWVGGKQIVRQFALEQRPKQTIQKVALILCLFLYSLVRKLYPT